MVRIVLSLLCTYQSSSSTTVMAVSDVESWHLSELLCDGLDVSIVGNNPELMTESVNRRNKVVLRLTCCIAHNQLIEHSIVRICEEHRLDVSVINANMLHAVFLLVASYNHLRMHPQQDHTVSCRSWSERRYSKTPSRPDEAIPYPGTSGSS